MGKLFPLCSLPHVVNSRDGCRNDDFRELCADLLQRGQSCVADLEEAEGCDITEIQGGYDAGNSAARTFSALVFTRPFYCIKGVLKSR